MMPVVVFAFSKRKCEECAHGLKTLDLTNASEKGEIHRFVEASIIIGMSYFAFLCRSIVSATHFTVIGNVPDRAEDVAPVRALLDAIDAEHPAFVVHLGNLKGRDEACSDTLLEARHDLLDSLIAPVIYIPGDHDWSDCPRPAAGSFDPVERLLRLRELFYPDANPLGQRTMTVMRQSTRRSSAATAKTRAGR